MTQRELDDFIREEIADCARDRLRAGSWPRRESLALAREELAQVIRWERAAATMNLQRLWAAHSQDGQTVGWLWVKLPPPGPWAGSAFLCQMTVAQAHRRHGYGRAMLAALEAELAAAGMTELRLNVCQENDAARALYAACGYEIWHRHQTILQLRKPLAPSCDEDGASGLVTPSDVTGTPEPRARGDGDVGVCHAVHRPTPP